MKNITRMHCECCCKSQTEMNADEKTETLITTKKSCELHRKFGDSKKRETKQKTLQFDTG